MIFGKQKNARPQRTGQFVKEVNMHDVASRHDQRKGGRSDRNTKAEPGFIKRRNRINGQFRAHLIEMLESPAWKALSLGARRVIDRIEIELARHGGNDNGRLPVTKLDFVEYGVHHNGVAPAIREAEALGFIRVTEHGRGGNAEHRQPNKFFLTFARGRDSRAQPPTDDWRKIKTTEEAEMIASRARNAKSVRAVQFAERRALKTKSRYLKPVPKCRNHRYLKQVLQGRYGNRYHYLYLG